MIVALQTADATTRIWLLKPEERAVPAPSLEWDSDRSLADMLLKKLTETLEAADYDLSDVTGFIIFSGPGSFTSLRIGHSVINALADSLSVPVVGSKGERWLEEGVAVISSTPLAHPALPFYGAEANITKPKA